MTASEIDAMPAGPEMDALVAEKVMEFVKVLTPLNNEQRLLVPKGQEHLANDVFLGESVKKYVPHYSTSDAAALEVLKKAKLSVVLHGGKWIAGHWDQQYLGDFAIDGGFYPQSEGDTIALAVCRASLKTKEKE